jgi:hypothetical protein
MLYEADKGAKFNSMDWDPAFIERSPALFVFAEAAKPLRTCSDWPSLALLQVLCDSRGITNARGAPLRLVGDRTDESYETRLYVRGELHVRSGDWHDLLNVLAWLTYPKTKAALNARHHEEESLHDWAVSREGRRSPVRDALTLFDESGAIVAASDPALLEMIRAFQWKPLFWTHRARVIEHLRVFVVGHALAGKLLAPYVGIAAHAVLLPAGASSIQSTPPVGLADVDTRAAELVRSGPVFSAPRNLAPLPVLGVPGWFPENACEQFYDNAAYFRPGRRTDRSALSPRREGS